MKEEDRLEEIMNNVMAAINTTGIAYNINSAGFYVRRKASDLLLKRVETFDTLETLDYIGHDGGEKFKTRFFKFLEEPKHSEVHGDYWADDDKYVIIQISRCCEMDQEYWQNYADWCGYDTPEEAQYNYGDPTPSYIRMNIRIPKGDIRNFVMKYAQYFWKY